MHGETEEASAKWEFEKAFRWMEENVLLASGVYCSRETDSLTFDPFLQVQNCEVSRPNSGSVTRGSLLPKMNSAAALVCCCYMEALGKVLMRGRGANETRFKKFITSGYLDGFREDAKQHRNLFPSWRKAASTLYTTFRNGFVHEFASSEARWDRVGRGASYWYANNGQPVLNIDRLASGVLTGLGRFRGDFEKGVHRGEHAYSDFLRWLGARDRFSFCRLRRLFSSR